MDISKAAVGIVAGLCLAVGAGGAYMATRGGAPPSVIEPSDAIGSEPSAAVGVEQSEAVVNDAPPAQPADVVAAPVRAASPAAARGGGARRLDAAAEREPARAVSTPRPSNEAPVSTTTDTATSPAFETARAPELEPVGVPEPPAPLFEELVVSADSVIGLQIETALTSESARVEDEVVARVTRDVRVGDRVAIPAGARAQGEVTLVERGGRLRDRARLGIRFTSIVLADGTRVPIDTETIYRDGDAPGGQSAAKIGGGAIGGAILGGLLGGAKGAILGGTAGAGAGSAAVLLGGRNAATLPAGAPVTVRIIKPATVTVEK